MDKLYYYEKPLFIDDSDYNTLQATPCCCCKNHGIFEENPGIRKNHGIFEENPGIRRFNHHCDCCLNYGDNHYINHKKVRKPFKKCGCFNCFRKKKKKYKTHQENYCNCYYCQDKTMRPFERYHFQDYSTNGSFNDFQNSRRLPKSHFTKYDFDDQDYDDCCCCCSCGCEKTHTCAQTESNQVAKTCTTQTDYFNKRPRRCCKCCRGKCGRCKTCEDRDFPKTSTKNNKVTLVKAEYTQHEEDPVKLDTTWENLRKKRAFFAEHDSSYGYCPFKNNITGESARLNRLLSQYSLDHLEKAVGILEQDESNLIKSSKIVKDVCNNTNYHDCSDKTKEIIKNFNTILEKASCKCINDFKPGKSGSDEKNQAKSNNNFKIVLKKT